MTSINKCAHYLQALKRHWGTVLVSLLFAIAIIELFGAYLNSGIDDGDWERFKADHDCRPYTDASGSQRLSWQCNDGNIYHRWRQQR